jgi:hypothetical protein
MSDPIPPHTVPHPEGEGEVISETRAKQGRGGRHMMVVMGVSLVLVAVAFAVIYVVAGPGLQRAENSTEAATTSPGAAQPLPGQPAPPPAGPPAQPARASTSPGA